MHRVGARNHSLYVDMREEELTVPVKDVKGVDCHGGLNSS